MNYGKVSRSWVTMLALLQAAAAAAQPEGAQAVLRALGALTGTAAAVFGRVTSELRQSQAKSQPAWEPGVFVAAALAREEALWLLLCCQVCCTQAGIIHCMAWYVGAKLECASLCSQAWGEQVAKARRKRGGREGGVLLDKSYNDALAAVREQAASGLRVRSGLAVRLDALYFECHADLVCMGLCRRCSRRWLHAAGML